MFTYLTQNLDKFIIGKILGASILGIYYISIIFTELIRQQLMAVVNKVMFSGFSKVQENLPRVKMLHLKIVQYSTLLIMPLLIIILFLSDAIILHALGSEWAEAAVPMQILSLASVVHLTGGATSSLMKGLGYAKMDMFLFAGKTIIISLPLIIFFTTKYGLIGAASAILFSKTVTRLVYQRYLKKLIQLDGYEVLVALKHPIICTLASITALLCSKSYLNPNNFQEFVYIVITTITIYIVSILYLNWENIKKKYNSYIKT